MVVVVGGWVMREKKRPKLRSMQDGWKAGDMGWEGSGSREKKVYRFNNNWNVVGNAGTPEY